MLAEFGNVCRAAGELSAAVESWQQALRVLRELGWPDLAGLGARLKQVDQPSSAG